MTGHFIGELQAVCRVCNHNTSLSDVDIQSKFHKSHELLLKKEIDSSYILLSEVIETGKNVDSSLLSLAYNLRGRILREKKLYELGIADMNSAIRYGRSLSKETRQKTYTKLGEFYLEQSEFDKAIELLEEWKRTSLESDTINATVNLHNLGLSYLHKENFDKAEKNLLSSYTMSRRKKDTSGMARSCLDIANLYYVQYKDALAIPFFEKGLVLATATTNLELIKNANLNLAVVEENRNDFTKALSYRKEYERIKDSIWNRDKIWELAQREKEMAIVLKEGEIEKLELTSRLQRETLSKERIKSKWYISIAIGLMGIVWIIGFFLAHFRKKNKVITAQKNALNDLNATKDKLFSILTHDLKTPISTIKSKLFGLLHTKGHQDTSDLKDSYELSEKTALLVDNTLNWILESKGRLVFKTQELHLKSIVDQAVYDYLPILNINRLEVSNTISERAYVLADMNTLKVVLRNIIDNAIKFSRPAERLIFSSMEYPDTWCLQLQDFGTGFNTKELTNESNNSALSLPDKQRKKGTGLGLKLCRDFVKRNNGVFNIMSDLGKGTVVSITLMSTSNSTL